jgi:hydroxymethylglutaryl-CoA reductase (NADPH)
MMGCAGSGRAPKLAEIVAATLLAGELSMAAALAEGELVAAHESLGRNRPDAPGEGPPADRPTDGGGDG